MPLSRKILPHGKAKIQSGVSGGSNVTSLNLDGTTLQLNQSNSQPQRTVNLNSLSGTPAGNDTELQFNNNGSFGGTDDLKWDGSKLKLGDSADTGNYFEVQGSDSENTYDVLVGRRRFPRISLNDRGSYTMQIWALGSELRFGTSAGSNTTAAFVVRSGSVGSVATAGAYTYGVFNVGTSDSINSSKVTIVDTAKPLTLAYDGSNYASLKVSSGGVLTVATNMANAGVADRFLFDGNHFRGTDTNAPSMRNETPSDTNPVFTFNNDVDTGMGRAAADTLSFIAAGAEQLRIADNVITLGDGVVLAPHASDNFTIDSPNGIILDGTSAANGVQYHDGGLEIMRISNSSSNPVIRTMVDAKDMIFQQFDGTEIVRFKDNLDVEVAGNLKITPDNKLYLGDDEFIDVNTSSSPNRMDFHIANLPRLHLDSGTLFSGQSGGPSMDLTPSSGIANYGFVGDTDTGMSRTGADTLVLMTGGTNAITIDSSQNVVIPANLTVQGTTTTIDSTTLSVKDKNIEMGVVSSPTDVTADGGGITLKGTTDKTFNWVDSTDSWTASEHIELASGKSFRINGNNVLNQTTLGSTVVGSSLTSVGTLTALTGGTGDLNWDSNTLFVDSSENRVGIGTNSPDVLFDVSGSAVIQSLRINANDGDRMRLFRRADNEMVIASESASLYLNSAFNGIYFEGDSSAVKMRLTGDGNLGIGTTGPDKRLHIHGATDTAFKMSNAGTGEGGSDGFEILQSNTGEIVLKNRESAALKFDTAGTNAMTIDSSQVTTFINTPVVGTMTSSDNSTKAASTAFVKAQSYGTGTIGGTATSGRIPFGDGNNSITSDANLTYNGSSFEVLVTSSIGHGGTKRTKFQHNNEVNYYSDGSETSGTVYYQYRGGDFNIARNAIHVKAYNDGSRPRYVGIGTTSPERKLHIMTASAGSPGYSTYANMILESDDHSYFQFSSPSNKVQGINFGDGNDNAGAIYYDHASDYMRFFAGASERMRIDSAGKVGIGTTSPNSKMTVQGDLDIPRGSRFRAGSTDSNQGIDIYHNNDGSSSFNGNVVFEGRSSGGDVVFRNLDHGQDYKFYAENDSGTEQLIMKIDGTEAAVGIGEGSTGLTTANGAYLHVTGSSNLLANFLSSDGIGEIRVGDSSKYTRLLTAGNQFKIMPFDGVELMVLDGSTEKVGIGTNAPGEKLDVRGKILVDQYLRLQRNTSTNGLNLTDSGGNAVPVHTRAGFFGDSYSMTPDIGEVILYSSTTGSSTATAGMVTFASRNDAGTHIPYAEIEGIAFDDTASGEDGHIVFRVEKASTMTEQMRLTETGLGIGTTSPAYELDVSSGHMNAARLYLNDANNYIMGDSETMYLRAHNDMYFNIDTPNDSTTRHFIWRANTSSEKMRLGEDGILEVKSGGKVGIGTAAPNVELDVAGDARIRGSNKLYFGDTDTTEYISTNGTDDLRIHASDTVLFDGDGKSIFRTPYLALETSAASEKMRFDIDNGRFGIGTNSPSTKLDIISTTEQVRFGYDSSNYLSFNVDSTGNTVIQAKTGNLELKTDTSSHDVRVDSKGKFRVDLGDSNGGHYARIRGTSNTPVLMAKSNGLVGIATESPNETLTVEGVLSLDETSAPSATSGYGKIYVKSSDSKLYFMNDSGTETDLTAGGGSSVSFGSDNQIPFTNSGGDDFDYSANLTFDGSTLITDADIRILDGEKLLLGTDSNFQIYGSAGSTKYITTLSEQLLIWNQDSSSAPIKLQATDTSNGIQFNIAGTEKGRFTSTGLGIGTTAPSYKLDVNGDANVSSVLYLGDSDTKLYRSSNDLYIRATSDILLNDTGGNVGVGIDPTSKLHVKGELDIQSGNQTILMGAGNSSTSRNDNALKLARVGLAHYENDEAAAAMIYASSDGTDNAVAIGGGTSGMNAATKLQFFTAANDTTTEGTEVMRITNNQKVGIGTSAPDSKLHVDGDIRLNGSGDHLIWPNRVQLDSNGGTLVMESLTGSDSLLVLKSASSQDIGIRFNVGGNSKADINYHADTDNRLKIDSNEAIAFEEAGSEIMRIAGGKVGIGTTTPAQYLHVKSGDTDQALKLQSTDGNVDATFTDSGGSGIIRFSTDTFKFYTDSGYSNNPLNLKGVNVGIGTTSPSATLHLKSSSSNVPTFLMENTNADDSAASLTFNKNSASPADGDELGYIEFKGDDSAGNSDTFADIYSSAEDVSTTTEDGSLTFRTNTAGTLTKTMVLRSSKVGIGETSPDDLLHLKGSSNVDIRLEDSDATGMGNMDTMIRGFRQSTEAWFLGTESGAGTLKLGITSGHTSDLALHTAGTERVRVTDTGKVGIGTNAPDTSLHVLGSVTSSPTKMITTKSESLVPAQVTSVNMSEDTFQYVCIAENGGIVDLALPGAPVLGETYRVVWETRFFFSTGGSFPSIVRLSRPINNMEINQTAATFTLKSNSSNSTFQGMAEIVCIDDGASSNIVKYVVQNTQV